MTGKHLYKKTSYLTLLLLCLSMVLSQHLLASTEPSDRHQLLVEFLLVTERATQWESVERLKSLKSGLDSVENDGLDPGIYQLRHIQDLIDQADGKNDPYISLSAAEDAMISGAYLEVLADLMLGRTRHLPVEAYLDYRSNQPDTRAKVLELAVEHLDKPATAIELARPNLPEYQQLRYAYQELKETHRHRDPVQPIFPDKPSLRPGMTDERIPLLRKHLQVEELNDDSFFYDDALRKAVLDYQMTQGLQADGIAGPQTLARLNRTVQQDLDSLRVNLERWRRVNMAMTDSRVVVNIAGANLVYYQQGEPVFSSRTQVGRQDRRTPLMLSEISHFTLNPTWTVPPTIYRKDKLPAIQQDPDYLKSNRLTVLDRQGNPLDPDSIDWEDPGSILLRQAAGPSNALGQVVIRFPNQQSIYLHDTPSQQLFDRNQRYFSSGCVRVEGATRLVSRLLDATNSIQASQFEPLLHSGRTQNISIGSPITIVLGYWTAEADSQGELSFHTDIYELDTALLEALNAK